MMDRAFTVFGIKKYGLITVKFLVTITLMAVLVSNAHWPTIFNQVQYIGALPIAVTLVILILSVTISAYKWKIFLSIHDLNFDFSTLHRYYFIAMYINNFLPTTIGGDGYRIYKTFGNERSKSTALIAVIMERVTGLVALLLLAFVSAIYLFVSTGDDIVRIFLIAAAMFSVTVAFSYYIFPARVFHRLTKRFRRIARIVEDFSSHIDDYTKHRHLTVKVVTVSVLFHFHLCMAYFVLLNFGLSLSVSFYELFVVLAVVGIIGILPISINGIGVVEGTFVFMIGQFGVDYDYALIVALLMRILVIPISMFGAVLFVLSENGLSDDQKTSSSSLSQDRTPSDQE